jgi:hypothetical protein
MFWPRASGHTLNEKNCHNTALGGIGFYSSTTSFCIFYFHLSMEILGFLFTSLAKMAFALF